MKTVKFFSIIILLVLLTIGITACSADHSGVLTSGDITRENEAQVYDILRSAKLSNVDVFETWVRSSIRGNLKDESESSGFSDANCRMTVMLLAGDLIRYDSVEEKYTGDYLMFDLDAIENKKEYGILKDKEKLFTTMFGEMPISENGFAESLADRWSKHGIRIDSEKCSVISILFKAYEQEEAFVGHTGILIDCRDSQEVNLNYVFVEKIAFDEPFRITLVKDKNELIDLLSQRADYSVEDGDPPPAVYCNGQLIGELKQ